MTVQVDGTELDVLMGGRESGAGIICTIHPFESMDAALPQLADSTQARVICVNPRGLVGRRAGCSRPDRGPACRSQHRGYDLGEGAERELGVESTFTAIEGAGHVPIAERPTEVAKAVRSFLTERVWT